MPVCSRLGLLLCLGLLCGGTAAHAQIEELPRPDSAHAASFGISVALGDSIAVVGASGEDAGCGPNSGAVYVYQREPGTVFDDWRGAARLTPRTCRPNTFFGERVALSGRRLLVSAAASETFGAAGTNAAYMFMREPDGTWQQTARFTAPSDRPEGAFASDIDLDGDRAVVSTAGNPEADRNGAVYVYDYDAARATWRRTARLTTDRDAEAGVLGRAVALDGDRLAVAASTYFEGDPGGVYLFEHNGSRWRETDLLRGIDAFFIELDLDGSTLLVGEDRAGGDGSGRATVFTAREDRNWTQVATLRPSQPYESGSFGTAVSLNGPWALITGYGEQLGKDFNIDRVVYVFRRRRGRTWTERTILDIGQVDFGAALDQYDSTAIISSVPEEAPGSVYVVQLR